MVAPQKIVMPCAHAMLQLYLTALGNNSHRLRDTADLQDKGYFFGIFFFMSYQTSTAILTKFPRKSFLK